MKFYRICSMLCSLAGIFISVNGNAQSAAAFRWADSVFNSLTNDQRIAQLLVVRSSGIGADGKPEVYDAKIDFLVKKYNIGAICAFQGTPLHHATMLNRIQAAAQTPIMVTVDAEWGLGMRMAGVQNYPNQLTMGAISDAELVYKVGKAIGEQCRRMNIHVNYAPVVDINNNANNPVIGLRSFGENKYKVALMGSRLMQGIQETGVMACAKHFPGHGDVAVDSHYDLPLISKTRGQLDSLELYPFAELFKKGVGSVMVAHLYIPAIDSTKNQATSLSYRNITELMRNELGYRGLTFTDALEMKGVAKFYPGGAAAVQSLIAGNDMLCLPTNVSESIEAIKEAIATNKLSAEQVYAKCKRVLLAKYEYVQGKTGTIDTDNLNNNLNKAVPELRREVAKKSLTVLNLDNSFFPLPGGEIIPDSAAKKTTIVKTRKRRKTIIDSTAKYKVQIKKIPRVVYLALGGGQFISTVLKDSIDADIVLINHKDTDALANFKIHALKKYKRIIIGLHGIGRSPAKNFGVPAKVVSLANNILNAYPQQSVLLAFGNPYILKNFTDSINLVACYEDDSVFQKVAANWLLQKFNASGTLPVTVGKYKYGTGMINRKEFEEIAPESVGANSSILNEISAVAAEAIAAKATPGCEVTVLKQGKMIFQRAYGTLSYTNPTPITNATLFDLASVTKIAATTIAVMKLVENGQLDIKQQISYYLPWLKESNKAGLLVENLLMHQAGLNAFIPFYKELMDKNGRPDTNWFSHGMGTPFVTTVANGFYLGNSWPDTMLQRIKTSALSTKECKYEYSDNGFILLGKIVETITGMAFDKYVEENFYKPLGMESTRFRAYQHFSNDQIAPTENEKIFRRQLIWGYVHDPGAAMFGNVAGHAGLFSNATDLAKLFQMLLNGGVYNNIRYLKKETIDWFSSYQSPISRRGLGFDKPEKGNNEQPEDKAYPCKSASSFTYGHTGFTGICVWVDPAYELVYIFMSNRVNPEGGENKKLASMNIRSRIQDIIYNAVTKK